MKATVLSAQNLQNYFKTNNLIHWNKTSIHVKYLNSLFCIANTFLEFKILKKFQADIFQSYFL